MVKTDLARLSRYDRMVIDHHATHIFPRYQFDYRSRPVSVFVELDEGRKKIQRIVAVLDDDTKEPINYNPRGIQQLVYREMKDKDNSFDLL